MQVILGNEEWGKQYPNAGYAYGSVCLQEGSNVPEHT